MSIQGVHLISGEDVSGQGSLRAINPSSGEILEPIFPEASSENIDVAVGAALSVHEERAAADPQKRAQLLEAAAERIDAINRIIQRNAKVPSKILEADFVENKKGDGFLGPSDFFFYARIKVAKEDLLEWTKGLKKPYNNSTSYSAPPQKEKWWISEKDFKKLKLYETKKYFGRFNGWIGFDESTGYLYVHTFTL